MSCLGVKFMPRHDREVVVVGVVVTPKCDNNTSQLYFSAFPLPFGYVFAYRQPMIDLIIKINS